MNDQTIRCSTIRLEFLDLLQTRLSPEKRIWVESHVRECGRCAGELQELRDIWHALPEPTEAIAPVSVRRRTLAYALSSLEPTESIVAGLWQAMRGAAVPGALGAAATAFLVLLMQQRGSMASLDQPTVVALSLALAATLAAVAGGLWRSVAPRRVHAVLLGSVGALGGYLLLTAISPIPDTVQFCRVALFRNVPMSMGEMCLVYLAVAVLYAGVPMGVAAYATGAAGLTWRAGLAGAGIFAVLSALTVVLQMGFEELIITLTVLVGLVAGSLVGGLGGNWVRSHSMVRASG